MTIDYDAILKTIVDANNKTDTSNAKNILKTDIIGNTIIGRFLPNIKDVAHSIYPYWHHGWTSLTDNTTKVFHTCLNTYGEKCPDCQRSIAMWKSKNPALIDLSKKIRRRSNTMVNFYVISDAKTPENNGTVKIFRYGKQIKDKVDMALTGDDKAIYGTKIWRLDDQGCNFRIKCEQNSESKEAWPTYTNSSFLPASKIEGMTEEKIAQILNSVYDLTKMFTRKSPEEMIADINKHFPTGNTLSSSELGYASTITEDITKMGTLSTTPSNGTATVTPSIAPPVSTEPAKSGTIGEDQVDAMLKELQDLGPTKA